MRMDESWNLPNPFGYFFPRLRKSDQMRFDKGGNHSEVIPSVKITGTVINSKGVICKIDGTLAIKAIIIPNGLAGFLGGMVSVTTLVQPAVDIASVTGAVFVVVEVDM